MPDPGPAAAAFLAAIDAEELERTALSRPDLGTGPHSLTQAMLAKLGGVGPWPLMWTARVGSLTASWTTSWRWRDSAGRTDDVLDEATGRLVPPAPDEELVWDGLGVVMPLGRPAITQPVGGSVAVDPPTTDYQAVLPVDAPVLRRDDVIRVAGSVRLKGPRDPQLVGRRFRVSDEAVGT